MFCSNCGAAVAQGTSFCNLCGAKLNGARGGRAESPELSPDSLMWAAVTVFVVGLGGLIGLLAVLKETVGFGNDVILAVTAAFLVMMFAIEAVLVGLLLRRTRGAKRTAEAAAESAETKELGAAGPHALHEPAPSVTEHATRTFEPTYVGRGAAKR